MKLKYCIDRLNLFDQFCVFILLTLLIFLGLAFSIEELIRKLL